MLVAGAEFGHCFIPGPDVEGGPAVLSLAAKITLHLDPALNWALELPPGRVEITAADGRSWVKTGEGVPGNADNPMHWDDIIAKFRECASVAAKPVAAERLARTQTSIRWLESAPDITPVIKALRLD